MEHKGYRCYDPVAVRWGYLGMSPLMNSALTTPILSLALLLLLLSFSPSWLFCYLLHTPLCHHPSSHHLPLLLLSFHMHLICLLVISLMTLLRRSLGLLPRRCLLVRSLTSTLVAADLHLHFHLSLLHHSFDLLQRHFLSMIFVIVVPFIPGALWFHHCYSCRSHHLPRGCCSPRLVARHGWGACCFGVHWYLGSCSVPALGDSYYEQVGL